MEILKANNKEIINTYLTPTLPYDIEGVLVGKDGKDIKIEKTIDNKVIEYSLRVKEEISTDLGKEVKIEKENIVSSKVEEKQGKEVKEEEQTRNMADILRELGLEYTEENIRMIEFMLSGGIIISKGNVESYIKSKEYLNRIINDIDTETMVKLIDRGINLEDENLQRISEVIEEIKTEKTPFSIKRFLKIDRELTFKEAEDISKEIYGQRMGRDVYTTIIALHKEKMPITRENIDKTMEVMGKIYNIKRLQDNIYIKILNEDMDFNINNLYRLNNSYNTDEIKENLGAKSFEGFTIAKETSIEDLINILRNLNIEENQDNINILREFVVNDMIMDRDKYDRIKSMKESLWELTNLLDHKDVINLHGRDINPLEENIHSLLDELKNQDKQLGKDKAEELKGALEDLGKITNKDLLMLIKSGEDFTIKSIKEIIYKDITKGMDIEHKTLEKVSNISNIFNTLGEIPDSKIISYALRRYEDISLNNLYMVQEEITTAEENMAVSDKLNEGLIFEEYLKARNNLTINMVKESIKEGKALEHMAIGELNGYIEKKVNRYKEIQKSAREIKDIKGNEEKILPIIMRNQMSMTLKEIRDINSYLNGEKGLSNILKEAEDNGQEFHEEIKALKEKISVSVKNGDSGFKEDYKHLMNTLTDSNSSFEKNREQKGREEYISIQSKISKKDIVFQLPIEMGNEYKNLNIMIPNGAKGVDKNNMRFFLSLDTENLGLVDIELNVRGKDIGINIKEEGNSLNNALNILDKNLQSLGYRLGRVI